MKRLTVFALVLATATGSWLVTKRLERAERARLEKWGGDAEMRAVRAEQRAEGYRRLAGGKKLAEADEAGPASALATAEFPFEGQLAGLTQQLALDAAQAAKLRHVYEKRWEAIKKAAGAPAAPGGLALEPLSAEAAPFLSAQQARKLAQIEAEQERVEVPKLAQQQATEMAGVLGLSEEQIRRMTEALTDMYRAPTSSASPVDQMKEKLRPILNAEQWKTLLASLENRDPPAATPR